MRRMRAKVRACYCQALDGALRLEMRESGVGKEADSRGDPPASGLPS